MSEADRLRRPYGHSGRGDVSTVDPATPLYHWAPTSRRKQIIRHGLRPRQRPSVSTGHDGFRQAVICLAESPSWAWALSGDMVERGVCGHGPVHSWDLWQTYTGRLTRPEYLPTYDDHRWHEVRTRERIYKRDLWYIATRTAT